MDRVVVFLGGIPGSGKSTLAVRMRELTGVTHVVAGDLLRKAKVARAVTGRVRVIDARDAQDNQALLIEAFHAVLASTEGDVLLDGHFVIPTEAGFTPVTSEVFRSLRVGALSVLRVDPVLSRERLHERTERARWWDGSVESLARFQEEEIAAATSVATAGGLRLTILDRDPVAELQRLLTQR